MKKKIICVILIIGFILLINGINTDVSHEVKGDIKLENKNITETQAHSQQPTSWTPSPDWTQPFRIDWNVLYSLEDLWNFAHKINTIGYKGYYDIITKEGKYFAPSLPEEYGKFVIECETGGHTNYRYCDETAPKVKELREKYGGKTLLGDKADIKFYFNYYSEFVESYVGTNTLDELINKIHKSGLMDFDSNDLMQLKVTENV